MVVLLAAVVGVLVAAIAGTLDTSQPKVFASSAARISSAGGSGVQIQNLRNQGPLTALLDERLNGR